MTEAKPRFDGVDADELARRCDVPRVALHDEVESTMDAAHDLAAAGAPAGTLVVTDRQLAGRGRGGRTWNSVPGGSLTFTLLERPLDQRAVGVLSLRLGLAVARVLGRWAGGDVSLKWPNDVLVRDGKVAGILVEARWRNTHPEWVAIGLGLNVVAPGTPGTAGLAPGATRVEILAELVPAMRAAARATGELAAPELAAWEARDWARGRRVVQPVAGVARGISADGALIVDTDVGLRHCSTGSLLLAETP